MFCNTVSVYRRAAVRARVRISAALGKTGVSRGSSSAGRKLRIDSRASFLAC